MSLRSMTGYGRGAATGQGVRVEVEISSVNRKQLDVQFSLPPPLRLLESRLQDEVGKALSRGRVSAEVAVRGLRNFRRDALQLNEEVAAVYVKLIRKAAGRLKLADDLSASLLLTMPGVVHYESVDEDVDRIWPVLAKALRLALRQLTLMRQREGEALQLDLRKRLDLLRRHWTAIRKLAPQVVEKYRRSLRARLEKAGLNDLDSGERLTRELVFFAERSDITEETTRLESHMGQAAQMMQSREPAGKALDFLAQEMYREINTIGSKANDAAITRHVVIFKAELERWREQVQNVE